MSGSRTSPGVLPRRVDLGRLCAHVGIARSVAAVAFAGGDRSGFAVLRERGDCRIRRRHSVESRDAASLPT